MCPAGDFVVYIPKAVHGEHFDDLDMITTLLARRKDRPAANAHTTGGIEVLSSDQPAADGEMDTCRFQFDRLFCHDVVMR